MPRPALAKRSDGRYRVKYKGMEFYGTSSQEAYAKLDAYKVEQARGLRHKSAGIVVSEYMSEWLPIHKHDVRAETYNQYACNLDQISAVIGQLKMQDVTSSDIRRVYNSMDGMGAWKIKKLTTLMRAVFRTACNDGIIFKNPCLDVAAPKNRPEGSHRPLEPWEVELVDKLAREETPHRFALSAAIMMYAGLRREEVIALDLDRDINWDKDVIHVHEAASIALNQPQMKETKSGRIGVRDVPIFSPLKTILQGKTGLPIVKCKGGSMSTQTSWRRAQESYLTYASSVAGKPVDIRAHDYRHTFCTMCYNAGVDIKTTARWMGHADEKMVLRVYTHLSDAKQESGKNAVEKLLSGSNLGSNSDE